MTLRIAVTLLIALASLPAQDSPNQKTSNQTAPNRDAWVKVRQLKTGAELRIIKKGAHQAILATFDDLTEDNLLIATKNEQLAIPKEDVERIDYRPKADTRVSRETRTTTDLPDYNAPSGPGRGNNDASSTSTSTNYSFGSKPDFQTIYRATASAGAK